MRGLCSASCFYFSLESVFMEFLPYYLVSLLGRHILCMPLQNVGWLLTFHISLCQDFSAVVLLTFWTGLFFVLGAVLCIVGWLAGLHLLEHLPRDNQNCVQALPSIPWGRKLPLVENPDLDWLPSLGILSLEDTFVFHHCPPKTHANSPTLYL